MFEVIRKKTSSIIESAEQAAAIADNWSLSPHIATSISRIREAARNPHLSLAVVGRFKTGKSTLINALVGEDLLPTDILPASICEVYVRYGETRKCVIEKNDGQIQIISLDEIKSHIAAGSLSDARRAELTLPSSLLVNGLWLVDTPGFEDIEQTRAHMVYEVLPEVDAIVLTFDATTGGISKVEMDFLQQRVFKSSLSKIICAVNKIDRLSPAERVIMQEYVTNVLKKYMPEPTVICVSAKRACEAGDDQGRDADESGIPRLLELIETLVSQDTGEHLLFGVRRETGRLIQTVESGLAQLKDAMNDSVQQLEGRVEDLEKQKVALEQTARDAGEEAEAKLTKVIEAFRTRFNDFMNRYRPKISQRIMAAPIEDIRDSTRLSTTIEIQIKKYLEKDAETLASETQAVFGDFVATINAKVKADVPALKNITIQTPIGPVDRDRTEKLIMPSILLGGWFVLGIFNFALLCMASALAGDIIKNAILKLIGGDPIQAKQEFAEQVSIKLDEIQSNIFVNVSKQLRERFASYSEASLAPYTEGLAVIKDSLEAARKEMALEGARREERIVGLNGAMEKISSLIATLG